MGIFDKDGLMIFPNPTKKEISKNKNVLVVSECFCFKGHSLIYPRASFNGLPGILLKVKMKNETGHIALSPIYGDKSKITLDIDLEDSQLLQLICPICDSPLPVYSKCSCEADLVALFLNKKIDFHDCIGICSRVNCFNSEIKSSSDLLNEAGLQAL